MLSLPLHALGLFTLLFPLALAQSSSVDNQDQEQLCTDSCIVSATCNNQCILKPQDQLTSCICQDNCLCAIAICEQCCIASGGGVDNPFCKSGASDNLLYCADPSGADLAPNNNCLVYQSITYNATALFPSTIEAFLNQVPLPTGIVFPAAQTSGSAVVAPAAASTTGALSATGLNSKAASFTGTTVPTTAKSTASLATLSKQSTTAAAGGATASSAIASSAGASSAGANSAAAGTPAPATATAKPNAGSRGLQRSRGAVLGFAVVLGLIAAL